MEVCENSKMMWKHYSVCWLMFPQQFSVSQAMDTCISIKQLDYELEISIV